MSRAAAQVPPVLPVLPVLLGIVRSAVRRGRYRASLRDALGTLALMALAAGAGYAERRALSGAWLGALAMLAGGAAWLWVRYVAGALPQNTPANAQLVPALNRRIRQASVLVWCLCVAPLAAIATLMPNVALWMFAAALLMTGSGATIASARGAGRAIGVWLALLAGWLLLRSSAMPAFFSSALAAPLLIVTCVLFALYTVNWLFPRAGHHYTAIVIGQPGAPMAPSDAGQGQLAPSRARRLGWDWYGRTLRRDLARPAAPGLLMLHALGPAAHPLAFVPMLVFQAGLGLFISAAVLWARPGAYPFAGFLAFLGYLYITSQSPEWSRLRSALMATGAEQALVRLSSAAPRLHDFNRTVGMQILKGRLLQLLCNALLVLVLLVPWGWNSAQVLQGLSMLVCPVLMAIVGVRDFSASPRPAPMLSGLHVLGLLGLIVCVGALMLASSRPLLWSAMMFSLLSASALLGLRNWRRMVAAAPVFPACRAARPAKAA